MPLIHCSLQRAAITLLFCVGPSAMTFAGHGKPSRMTAFDHAEHLREALEGRPQAQRARGEYTRVLDAYRAIYHANAADPEADAAVDAVASLLAEEGRSFSDPQLVQDAAAQYAYLLRNYPGSHFRQSALVSQAEIEESDLHDYAAARSLFSDFLKQYPHSPLASEARQQLKAIDRQPVVASAQNIGTAATRAEEAAKTTRDHARELAEMNRLPPANAGARARKPQFTTPGTLPVTIAQPAAALKPVDESHTAPGQPILITGIRHWSTPVYTRVAIDLSDQVQYEAARVPNPDRIYFDLHGAHLAPGLIGKSFDVTDDGYLRRVRAAQYANDATRIVLDVSHVSEYSAFFLPNPWRLIVDIHGSTPGTAERVQAAGKPVASQGAAAGIASATLPVTQPAGLPAASASSQEIASLGHQATRIKATHRPTTSPIAASVSGTTRATQPNELEDLAGDEPPGPAMNTGGNSTRDSSAPVEAAGSTVTGGHSHRQTTAVAARLAPEIPSAGAHEATPTATGERSLVRALGLKIGRIVIDAGHGGHDSGTLGPDGIEEKTVVLDVALRLGKLLKQRLGADVIYTRDDDTFIPLETRTAIANKAQADLFISVHANSSSDASARGVEVYYLNFTTSPEALEVAARENAVSDQSIYQLSDLVKKITLKDKIDESHEFAADVENSLFSGLEEGNAGLKDRGVKKAPFVVLIGANMPSILAEISFLTNPEDARQLDDPAYRQRIAESLYRGVAHYVAGLSGVRLAQTGARPSSH